MKKLDAARSGSLRVKNNGLAPNPADLPSLKGCIDTIFPSTSLCGNSSSPSSLQHDNTPHRPQPSS